MLWHYRVLLIDLPGHGSREQEPFTMEAGASPKALLYPTFADS